MEENRRKFTLPETKTNRLELRKNLTPAESVMWKILKGKQIDGVKFRRQHSVGEYVMDFYSPSLKLCIELDGEVHTDSGQYLHDTRRTDFLNEQGITVLRYDNDVVFKFSEAIIQSIKNFKNNPRLIKGDLRNFVVE